MNLPLYLLRLPRLERIAAYELIATNVFLHVVVIYYGGGMTFSYVCLGLCIGSAMARILMTEWNPFMPGCQQTWKGMVSYLVTYGLLYFDYLLLTWYLGSVVIPVIFRLWIDDLMIFAVYNGVEWMSISNPFILALFCIPFAGWPVLDCVIESFFYWLKIPFCVPTRRLTTGIENVEHIQHWFILLVGGSGIILHFLASLVHGRNQSKAMKLMKESQVENLNQLEFFAKYNHIGRSANTIIFAFAGDLEKTVREILSLHPDVAKDSNLEQCFAALRYSREHSLFLLNRLVEYYQIQEGKVVLSSAPISLAKTLKGVVYSLQRSIIGGGSKLLLDKSTEQGQGIIPVVIADRNRVEQIFRNVVSNALKYTKKGNVKILYGYEMKSEEFWFDVTDTGKGMTPQQVETVFDENRMKLLPEEKKKEHEYNSSDFAVMSLGIGLVITKKFVDAMHGTIEISSGGPGLGTKVKVRLSLPKASKTDDEDEEIMCPYSFDVPKFEECGKKYPLKMMVVEDESTMRKILQDIIDVKLGYKKCGLPVYVAENGKEAFDMVKKLHENGKSVDLIWMDLNMPVCGGIEATKLIKNRLDYQGSIVTSTGTALRGSTDDFCRQYEFDGWLGKPFRNKPVLELIRKAYSRKIENLKKQERKEEERKKSLLDFDERKRVIGGNTESSDDVKGKEITKTSEETAVAIEEVERDSAVNQHVEAKMVEMKKIEGISKFRPEIVLLLLGIKLILGIWKRGILWNLGIILFSYNIIPLIVRGIYKLLGSTRNFSWKGPEGRQLFCILSFVCYFFLHVCFGCHSGLVLAVLEVTTVTGISFVKKPGMMFCMMMLYFWTFVILFYFDVGPTFITASESLEASRVYTLTTVYLIVTQLTDFSQITTRQISLLTKARKKILHQKEEGKWYIAISAHELCHPTTAFFIILSDLGEMIEIVRKRNEEEKRNLLKKAEKGSMDLKGLKNVEQQLEKIELVRDYLITTFRASQFIFRTTDDLCEYFRMKKGKLELLGMEKAAPMINLSNVVMASISLQRQMGMKEVNLNNSTPTSPASSSSSEKRLNEEEEIEVEEEEEKAEEEQKEEIEGESEEEEEGEDEKKQKIAQKMSHIRPVEVVLNSEQFPSKIMVKGDGKRISDVIYNVLSNAAKYCKKDETSKIEIDLSFKTKNSEKSDGIFQMVVKDNGIGMSEKTIQNLFVDDFFTGKRTKVDPGLRVGFGLFMNRFVVESLMGGNFQIESKLGVGTTVTVCIPFSEYKIIPEVEKKSKEEEEKRISGKNKRKKKKKKKEVIKFGESTMLIIVDDDRTTRFMMARIVQRHGFSVQKGNIMCLSDGPECIREVGSLINRENNKIRHIILVTDLNLGGINGLQLSLQIKKILERTNIRSYHYLNSSTLVKFDVLKKMGCVMQFRKPFKRDEMQDMMSQVSKELKKEEEK